MPAAMLAKSQRDNSLKAWPGSKARSISQPALLKTSTIGSSPSRAALPSSQPVIWKAPSPTSTSGRWPVATCKPRAAGTP